MVELLGIYKTMEHQNRGRVGNFKTIFCRNHRQKNHIIKAKLLSFFSQGKGRSLGVTPVTTFFYETRGFIFVFKNELKS